MLDADRPAAVKLLAAAATALGRSACLEIKYLVARTGPLGP